MLDSVQKSNKKFKDQNPKILTLNPVQILGHPPLMIRSLEEQNNQNIKKLPKLRENQSENSFKENFKSIETFPIVSIDWSCFSSAGYLAGVSAAGKKNFLF